MRTTLRLLTLILSFELITGPVQNAKAQTATPTPTKCDQGEVWDSRLNQCLTTQQVSAVNQSMERCNSMITDAEKQACYRQNADAALEGAVNSGDVKNNTNAVDKVDNITRAGTAAAIAVPLFLLSKSLFNKKFSLKSCKPASLMLMYGGAMTLLVGDVWSYLAHKSRLKKIDEDWAKIVAPDGSASTDAQKTQATEAQSQSFEMLARNEESIAKAAKFKAVYYAAGAGMFAAGTTMAIIEQIQLVKAKLQLGTSNQENALATINRLTCMTGLNKDQAAKVEDYRRESNKIPAIKIDNQNSTNSGPKFTPGGEGEELDSSKINNIWGNPSGSYYPNPFLNPKLKNQALNNLKYSKNAYEFIELMHEYENIEFENYSRLSYGEDLEISDLKKISFNSIINKIMTNILINSTYAQECNGTDVYDKNQDACIPSQSTSMGPQPYQENSSTNSQKKNINVGDIANGANTVMEAAKNIKGLTGPKNQTSTSTNTSNSNGISSNTGTTSTQTDRIIPIEAEKLKQTLNGTNAKKVADAEQSVDSKVNKLLYSPTTRIALNGLFGTWVGVMSGEMIKQQKISADRADLLRKMKEDFNYQAGIQNCTEGDRNTTSKPYCYCYTSTNQRNPARLNSQICNNLWGTKTSTASTDDGTDDEKVCVTSTNVIDAGCTCKTTNSCMKVGTGYNMSINPGTFKTLSVGTGTANDLMSGVASAGSMDAAAIGNNAARIKAANDATLAKIDPTAAQQAATVADQLGASLVSATSGMSMSSPGLDSSPSLANMTPAEAAKALEEELKDSKPSSTSAGGSYISGGVTIPDEPLPEFGMTEKQLAVQEMEVANVMNKNIDYGNNDINNGSNTNIFEVLSNRYQRSAMKHLFNNGEKIETDKPNKTDITQ